MFRAAWKDFNARFKNILNRLSRHREFLERQAALLHFDQFQQSSQEAHQHVMQYQQDRVEIIDCFEKQEQEESKKKFFEALAWISGAQTSQDHESFCTERAKYPGTGSWILKQEKVHNWIEADTPMNSILWLNGIPGAGKC